MEKDYLENLLWFDKSSEEFSAVAGLYYGEEIK